MSDENKKAGVFAERHERSAGLNSAAVPDFTKRRLVRGAVAGAPVLLTLRSGALAAESCSGVQSAGINTANVTGGSGTIQAAIQAGTGNPPYTPAQGDYCVTQYFTCSNTSNTFPRVQSDLPLDVNSSIGVVTETSSGSGVYQCKNLSGTPLNGALAIASSVTSFY
ncbi:hypothetical protein [Methylomagnum ishizawai]|uniref:hypothetical protein n=1 Tax=Methylomagnum ishizawai TaxID=1760988 RepID=UPI001C341273|nr:hypothetical protein [Methylomagnum ishizawai]BBL73614.1 hypothetical protein MishRS11D_07120 [Methylomagnum ishizawai]